MTIADVEFPNPIARDARLARDRPDQIPGPHPVAFADAHEDACELTGAATRLGALRACVPPLVATVRGTLGGSRNRPFRFGASSILFAPLAFEDAQRGGRDLQPVELGQERFQRQHLAHREPALQLCANRGAD